MRPYGREPAGTVPLAAGPPVPGTSTVLVTDLDGTLLDADGLLADRTARALRAVAAGGTRLVFATARPAGSARAVLAAARGLGAVLVSSNGAVVGDLDTGETHQVRAMTSAAVRAVVARLEPGTAWAVDRESDRLLGPGWPDVLAGGPLVGRPVTTPPGATDTEPVLCLMVTGPLADPSVLSRAQGLAWTSSRPGLVEFSAHGADKVTAVAGVLRRLGRTWKDVVAFGDARNDVELVTAAGKGIAVANACPEVLAVADAVAPHHADDGVAAWLEERCPTLI